MAVTENFKYIYIYKYIHYINNLNMSYICFIYIFVYKNIVQYLAAVLLILVNNLVGKAHLSKL